MKSLDQRGRYQYIAMRREAMKELARSLGVSLDVLRKTEVNQFSLEQIEGFMRLAKEGKIELEDRKIKFISHRRKKDG